MSGRKRVESLHKHAHMLSQAPGSLVDTASKNYSASGGAANFKEQKIL